jgi:hypothetical protein
MRKHLMRITFVLLITFGFLLLPPIASTAHAAGVVSTCDELNLRAALSGGGTVTFSCDGTIQLSSPITISSDTTIDGSGHTVAISGNVSQVFIVNSGIIVTMQNLSISNSYSEHHSAITNVGTLTISNCTFSNNESFSDGDGGAIWNGSTLTISNSTFNDNHTIGNGGAIANLGTLTVTSSSFNNNSSHSSSPDPNGYGGAIFNSGTLLVRDSHFAGNSAEGNTACGIDCFEQRGDGGAIYGSSGGTVTVVRSTFTGGDSGAIDMIDSKLTIKNSTFDHLDRAADPSWGAGVLALRGTVTISNSTFSENQSHHGAGIYAEGSTLTITNTSFLGNTADGGGGGVHLDGGTVNITRNLFWSNQAVDGGGISVGIRSSSARIWMDNNTFYTNNASDTGGAVSILQFPIFFSQPGQVTIANSTFSRNSAPNGGGIFHTNTFPNSSAPEIFTIKNTILAHGDSGGNCAFEQSVPGDGTLLLAGDYNFSDDGSCNFTAPHSMNSTDPKLVPALLNNGGPTGTVALDPTSPAVDFIPPGACTGAQGDPLTTDQRGYFRISDSNYDGVANCDSGAFELYSTPSTDVQKGPTFAVNTTADSHETLCLKTTCSLHDAIMMANAWSLRQGPGKFATVKLAADTTYVLDSADSTTPYGANGLPIIIGRISLQANGSTITRASALNFRFFQVNKGGNLIFNQGTLSSGIADDFGGALLNIGTMTLNHSTLRNHTSSKRGGAIFNVGRMRVLNSTIHSNQASGLGGGVFNQGTLTIANSTLTGNSAGNGGGLASKKGSVGLINATLSKDNVSKIIREIVVNGGSITFANTIVGDAAGARNCHFAKSSTHTDQGNNLDSGNTCGFSTSNGSIIKKSPNLATLADNGGPTQTMALQTGSPAINAGNNTVCNAAPVNNLDQRGVTRITTTDPTCDLGAYEAQ